MLSLLWALVVIFSLTGTASVKTHYNATNEGVAQLAAFHASYEDWLKADDVGNLAAELEEMNATGSNPILKAIISIIAPAEGAATVELNSVLRTSLTPNIRARLLEIKSLLGQYARLNTRQLGGARSRSVSAELAMVGAKSAIGTKLAADFGQLTPLVLADLKDNGKKIGSTLDQLKTIIIALTILSVILGGFTIVAIIRSIVGPLSKVAAAAKRLALGAVDIEIDVHGRDEIATVADSFRDAIASQKRVADGMVEFSDGNLAVAFEPRSDEDVLGHAFVDLRDQMRRALGEKSTTRELQSGMGELLDTLQHLEHGLQSMNEGDLTVAVAADLSPITPQTEGTSVGFVADSYNAMIESAQASLDGYNAMRETLREKLGDHSSLDALTERLQSLTAHCLTDLKNALGAMNDGDLTTTVTAVTSPIDVRKGEAVGQLAETFNLMLGNAQSAIGSYNDMRGKLAAIEQRDLAEQRVAVRGLNSDGIDLRRGGTGNW